jgi:hypothetical protein
MVKSRSAWFSVAISGFIFADSVGAWPPDGTSLSTAAWNQDNPAIASDGAGGAIVVWDDGRLFDHGAIFASRVDASGSVLWSEGGVRVCNVSASQNYPQCVSDGAGGAIIAWHDFRNEYDWDVYVQRLDSSGEAVWPSEGVPLCTEYGSQQYPTLVPDGSGGAIVTWMDGRASTWFDIFAQRVDALGNTSWTTNGVALCTAENQQHYPMIVSDGDGGAIVAWQDFRSTAPGGVFVQRVDASGTVLWTPQGVELSSVGITPVIASNGSGGAIVAWHGSGVHARGVDASGVPSWPAVTLAVQVFGLQYHEEIASDGAGGAIVVWADRRDTNGGLDIYARRVTASGSALWDANGVAICAAADDQDDPSIISIDGGGAIITWDDARSGFLTNTDIYSQRVDGEGIPRWAPDGVGICTAVRSQGNPVTVSNGAGAAIVAWTDIRNGSASHWDVYAGLAFSEDVVFAYPSVPQISTLTLRHHPNPVRGSATLQFELPASSVVQVEVFDSAGRRVARRSLGDFPQGRHGVALGTRDDAGRRLPAGVYFCRVLAAGEAGTTKMTVVR